MKIYIPTRGRVNKQTTLDNLPPRIKDLAVLVCTTAEAAEHQRKGRRTLSCDLVGIGPVRQWILDNADSDQVIMFDDDLRFAARDLNNRKKFVPMREVDYEPMLRQLRQALVAHAHVSIRAREGANNDSEDILFNIRMLRALGYNRRIMQQHNIRFDRVHLMEDFDVALQLLSKGCESVTFGRYVQDNSGGSNSAGGCSIYRTMELQRQAAIKLKELHPQFVTLVEKTTKTAWGGGTRTDVKIAWKEAYKHARK